MAPKVSKHDDSNSHQVHFEGIPKVTFEEAEKALHSAEDVARSMKTDADKAEEWIQNAKTAIDIANRSLGEAGKLASRVQKTAEDTAAKMTEMNVSSEDNDTATTVEPGKASSENILDAADQKHVQVDLNHSKEHCADEYEDILALQKKAQDLQAVVGRSAMALKDTGSKLTGTALSSAVDMKDQADDLTVNLEETIEEIKAKQEHRRTRTPVDAEDILKGDATQVDPLSRDKIDGVLDLSRTSARKVPQATSGETPPVKEDTPVGAEDVLKTGGVLNADPASLDKIDGLQKHTQNAQELAFKEHTNPTLTV